MPLIERCVAESLDERLEGEPVPEAVVDWFREAFPDTDVQLVGAG